MLRNLLIAISLILFSSTSFAKTNLPVLICNSFAEVEGWDGSETEAILSYTAYIKSSTKLVDAVVTGPYFSDKSDVKVNKTTKNYVQFQSLEDAWFWFDLSIPKGFDKIEHSFIGNVDVHGEEMFGSKL